MAFRQEKDSMGTMHVPVDAYYGAQTQRAVENFPVSDLRMPAGLIRALALIKENAARVNMELGHLDARRADAIAAAAAEIVDGALGDQFVVDLFQTGSGTSTNMNVNEVIAARANERITGRKGGKSPVHPNDHVNLGQSSNDTIPSAIHVGAAIQVHRHLLPALDRLHRSLEAKATAFADIRKIGRTHLQDAVPMTLGQEFSGYARQIALAGRRVGAAAGSLEELALGGTAVGTGLNADPRFAAMVITRLSQHLEIPFREASNHFQAQAAPDALVDVSGALKSLAVSLVKIANDLRWLSSGPRCGLGELNLPALQPGSSIMPGKINPVIPEAVLQVAAQVVGNDTTITFGGQAGNFELNVMLPVLGYNLMQSVGLLAAVCPLFAEKCIDGITVNEAVCAGNIEKSLAMATGLVPHIGYDRAAAIAKRAHATGKTIREAAIEENLLPVEQLNRILAMSFTKGSAS